jgi:hypothetical protein
MGVVNLNMGDDDSCEVTTYHVNSKLPKCIWVHISFMWALGMFYFALPKP